MHKFTNLLLSATLVVSSVMPMAAAPVARKISAVTTESAIAQKAAPMKAPLAKTKINTALLAERKHKKNTSFVESASQFAGIRHKGKPAKLPAADPAGIPSDFQGLVVFSDLDDFELGWYSVPTSASQDFDLQFLMPDVSSAYMAVYTDGYIYEHDLLEFWGMIFGISVNVYDAATGELAYMIPGNPDDLSTVGIGGAVDPTTGTIYGIMYTPEASGLMLATIAYSESACTVTKIADIPAGYNPNVLVCDKNGQLYTVDKDGILYKIDKTSAEFTAVGETGLEPEYLASATIDQKTNRMFYAVSDADDAGFMAEVDLTTGAASMVYEFPGNEEVLGLTIPFIAEDGAPGAVTDFAVEFVEGSLSGTFSFNTPTTLFDGTAGSGQINYKVLANGEEVAQGVTAYGAVVTGNIEVEVSGNYTFVALCSNSVGNGPKTTTKAFVGVGTAEAPQNVKAEAEGYNVTLTWDAVTTSVDGGYINPAEVVYNVTRYHGDDEEIIASRISATTVTDVIPTATGIEAYYYEVTAEYDQVVSAAAVSNTLVFGSVTPPFSHDFSETQSLEGFNVIDANGDGKTWTVQSDGVRVTYNSNLDMDDYLVFPPMNLEAGKLYIVTAAVAAQSASYTEAVEIVYGTEMTPEGLSTKALDYYEVTNTAFEDVYGYVIPEADGKYFIAVHGVSEADAFYLKVASVAVSAGQSALIPAAVEDLTVEAVAPFQTKATITFKAPAKNMKGETITTVDKIEIFRDEESIKTFTNVAAGSTQTFTDDAQADGTYTYSVVPSNAEGNGPAASASVYVGAEKPGEVAKPTIVETTTGSVKLTWDAVTVTASGAALPAEYVTYTVVDSKGDIVVEGLTTTTYDIQVCEAGEQVFAQFAVVAVTAAGNGGGEYSDMIAVGTPYTDYNESFADGELHYILGVQNLYGSPEWGLYDDSSIGGVTSADGDNGFLAMYGQYTNYAGCAFTGLIDVPAEGSPVFTFKTYNIIGDSADSTDENIVTVSVREKGSDTETKLFEKTVYEMGGDVEGWVRGVVDLSAYKGKAVQIYVGGNVQMYTLIMFDQFMVGELLDYDLAIASVKAPEKVKPGQEYVVDVTVSNEGSKAAGEFNVELYVNDELTETEPYDALAAGETVTATFGVTASPIAAEPIAVQAKVVYAADQNTDNNESKVIEVVPVVSNLPYVQDLAATENEGSAVLTWTAPNTSDYVVGGNVDFEDGEAGQGIEDNYGDWIFIDGDESPVGGFQGMDVPGITPGSTLASFFIFDDAVGNQTFAAHSGHKYLATLYRADDGQIDDWAISPELSGTAQTVSLWAKSYSGDYPEKISFLYSTGSLTPEDFVVVTAPFLVPATEWTQYTFDVPAGAKRFAIRSCAAGSFMLMIDDVEFSPAGADGGITIDGYNIYRDGEKINTELVKATTYTDAVEDGTYAYNVTAVYSMGESRASNTATVTVGESGLNDLAAGLKISAADGNIIVSGAAGKAITVNTVDGKTIFSTASAGAQVKVAVSQGIYLVKAGQTVAKVIVK